ncbi:MAG TPA: hypothetical protein VME18_07445 [Acidobacteriaceae bacterium]|nr:hypothetical protein [Acidobacteriaceae bacterium]
MRKLPVLFLLACAVSLSAQTPAASTGSNAAEARAALDDMMQALGGNRWLNLRNSFVEGTLAAFYEDKPTGVTVRYWQWTTPDEQRIDLTEKKHDPHNWVQIYTGRQCWEITWQGKKAMARDVCDSAIRRRDHSIQTAVRVWMKNPNTLLIDDGQTLAERHLAEQVTLLDEGNDAITIQMDAETHLPLSCSWSWRDPVYHDKDTDVEEYADYHLIDGIPTPFTITRLHNGDMVQQLFVLKAAYNVPLPPDGFDMDAIAAKVVRVR